MAKRSELKVLTLGCAVWCLLLGATHAMSQDSAKGSDQDSAGMLRIEMIGLAAASGKVYLSIYDSKSTWLGKKVLQTVSLDIEENLQGEFVIAEVSLPLGEYALSVFYDRNGNGKLDTNFIGMPKEPIAVSNNAKMKFGPPKYDDAKFTLSLDPVLQQIILEDI